MTNQFRIEHPYWGWVRDNFKLPAVLTIAGVVAVAVGSCLGMYVSIRIQGNAISSISTNMVSRSNDINEINKSLQTLTSSVVDIARGQKDQGDRLSRLEGDYDVAYREAAKPIPRKRLR